MTNKAIIAALKPFCHRVVVRKEWVSLGCDSLAQRGKAIEWVYNNLACVGLSVWYANRSYSAHIARYTEEK